MRRNNPEYKIWKKRNDEKKLRNRLSKRHRKPNAVKQKINNKIIKFLDAVEILSLRSNPEKTIKFFNAVLKEVRKINVVHTEYSTYTIVINMENVKELTEDAIMYLITIVKNSRLRAKKKTILWKVLPPKAENVRQNLQKSGFIKFFNHNTSMEPIPSGDNMQITTGKKVDTSIMKKICDFVKEKSLGKVNTRFLYKMLTELMSNTTQHAYTNSNIIFSHAWYVFAEDCEEIVRITFMDNGLGIPNTINKKRREKIGRFFGVTEDNKLVHSALKGEFRSETKNKSRGKGLPEIYEPSLNGDIQNLTIISNKAYFNEMCSRDLKENLEGTIFCWEIRKEK